MNNFEIESINTSGVRCYGRKSPYDHPAVYLKINKITNEVICPYCSKKFKMIKD